MMKVAQGFLFILLCSCIDRIAISIPGENASQLVVDGLITDEPGPYTVKLSLSSSVNGFLQFTKLVTAKRVTIFDNAGNEEVLTEVETGTYQTKPDGIRGVIGREYAVRIETQDGKVYESIPDKMNPAGSVDSLYYRVENFKPISSATQHGLRVYVNSQGTRDGNNLFRWNFTGVFEVETYPEFNTKELYVVPNLFKCAADPRPCSGFEPFGLPGIPDVVPERIRKVAECTCCKCWVNEFQDRPYVSDNQIILNGKFQNVEVGYVSIRHRPFQIKYRLEVKQMSLSQNAFDYWKIIQSQKEGASSLFQPPSGKPRTNIFEINGARKAEGLFYASGISKKQKYLGPDILQGLFIRAPDWNDCLADRKIITEDCRLAFPFSTNIKPNDWQ